MSIVGYLWECYRYTDHVILYIITATIGVAIIEIIYNLKRK